MLNQVLGKFSPAWKRACTDLYPQMEDAELQISANSNRRGLTKEKLKEIKGKAVRKLDTVACQFIRRQRALNDFIPVLFFFFFFSKKKKTGLMLSLFQFGPVCELSHSVLSSSLQSHGL